MPELPEVEIMTSNIRRWTLGHKLMKVEGIPFPKTLLGSSVKQVYRRGKYCILDLEQYSLLVHFRMTGKMLIDRLG